MPGGRGAVRWCCDRAAHEEFHREPSRVDTDEGNGVWGCDRHHRTGAARREEGQPDRRQTAMGKMSGIQVADCKTTMERSERPGVDQARNFAGRSAKTVIPARATTPSASESRVPHPSGVCSRRQACGKAASRPKGRQGRRAQARPRSRTQRYPALWRTDRWRGVRDRRGRACCAWSLRSAERRAVMRFSPWELCRDIHVCVKRVLERTATTAKPWRGGL